MLKQKHASVSDLPVKLAASVAVILALVFPSISYAQEGLQKEVDSIELAVLGTSRANKPFLERVDYLEKSIWGETNAGSLQTRIEALGKFAGSVPQDHSSEKQDSFAGSIAQNRALSGQDYFKQIAPAPEPRNAGEFESQEIEAINKQAQNESLSPSDQSAIQSAQHQQKVQALKRKAAAASCVLAIRAGRTALRSTLRNVRW